MAYATTSELKTYLGVTGSGDDALLETLLDRATSLIDTYTGYTFAAVAATRIYQSDNLYGDTLYLDSLLISVTKVTDGQQNEICSDSYVLLPRSGPRYHAIKLIDSSWNEADNGDVAQITGTWGWSETPPDDIVHACVRLAAFLYRQKDAQVFDVAAFPEAGVITLPRGIPADVKLILDKYTRLWGQS
jgi:hypothetical protein